MAGNKGGQPTKYKAEYCNITPYLARCIKNEELPTICGYAVYLGTFEENLHNWKNKHVRFFKSLRELLAIQKAQLVNKGLLSTYNSTIAKLMLSSNHGMAEKTETLHGLDKATVSLLGLIDGKSKGKLPDKKEEAE